MDNIHSFNAIRIIKIAISIILLVVFLLLFINFQSQYGVIPTEKNICVGDTIAETVIKKGVPDALSFEKESNSLYLEYNDKNVFGFNMDAAYAFRNNALCEISYSLKDTDVLNSEKTYMDIYEAISDNLNSDFTYTESADFNNKISEWSYSTGAKSETISLEHETSDVSILIYFQY